MSTAYSDMTRDGVAGASRVTALYRTVAAVARIRRFPPPDGYDRWTADAITETAHDFLVARDGVDRLAHLFRLAVDDDSFDRLLHASVRNCLRSRARATERGALIRRLRTVLEGDARFCTVGESTGVKRWTLT